MSEESIFTEVSEELRSERMRTLWRRFGPWIIGGAVLIVLLVAANEGWRWYTNSTAAAASGQFYSAMDAASNGDMAGAQEALNQTIADGAGGYPTLARFAQAALLAQDGKTGEAVQAYDALATSESDQHLRDLALLFSASLLVDKGDVSEVESRVNGLVAPDNALRNSAREILGLTQYTAGDGDAARKTFAEIFADNRASMQVLQRVQLYDSQLQAEGFADPTGAEIAADAAAADAADSGDATAPDAAAADAATDTGAAN